MCAAMLTLQAVVLFLVGVVSIGLTDASPATVLGIGLGLALLCLVAAGLLRGPVGYGLGWLLQVVTIASGFVVTTMFFLGVIFAALWTAAYLLGGKIDRERVERVALEEQWQAEHPPS